MESALTEILYSAITHIVPSVIAIIVPLLGAFWIFKVREKAAAEGKIFEFGREIANIIQTERIRGPIDGGQYYYIDDALATSVEPNRDKAIKQLLEECFFLRRKSGDENPQDAATQDVAKLVVAIATERTANLIPAGVKWSGKGFSYSIFGEEIQSADNYFPFGTKLYRHWMERFSLIYNDLWVIVNNRSFFVDSFVNGHNQEEFGVGQDCVNAWLDSIKNHIESIRSIHAKIITQLQIIDTQIDIPRLNRDIAAIFGYCFLLFVSGYIYPKLLYYLDLFPVSAVFLITIASVMNLSLFFIRISCAVKPRENRSDLREMFLPKLKENLKRMEKSCLKYESVVINDILSLSSDLKLKSKLKKNLSLLVSRIAEFNGYCGSLKLNIDSSVSRLKDEFSTSKINQQGFRINYAEIPDEKIDLEDIKKRIIKEDVNFTFAYEGLDFTVNVFTINLADLDKEQRSKLCDRLDEMRKDIGSSEIFSSVSLSYVKLQRLRVKSLLLLDRMLAE